MLHFLPSCLSFCIYAQERHSRLNILFILLVFFFWGCAPRPPLHHVTSGDAPVFTDDHTQESLLTALQHHKKYLQSLPKTSSTIAGKKYNSTKLLDSLTTFTHIISTTANSSERSNLLKEQFSLYQAGGREDSPRGEMLVTGYYEPLLEGSLEKIPPFIYPLYLTPTNLIVRKNERANTLEKGRLDAQGNFLPYWTRAEIEDDVHLVGNELVYLKDPFEAFLLHVQGSGKIQLRDGSQRSIHYASDNGQEYNSIGKLFVDEEKMALEEVNIPAIKTYFRNHPEDQKRILHHNKKYIFFQWEDDKGPYGSLGIPLTPGRSIAVDAKVLPMNTVAFLISQQPDIDESGKIVGWKPLHRFVLPQDTGSAIQGSGRVDLFWGNGKKAPIRAGSMKEQGKLYFLIKKK